MKKKCIINTVSVLTGLKSDALQWLFYFTMSNSLIENIFTDIEVNPIQ